MADLKVQPTNPRPDSDPGSSKSSPMTGAKTSTGLGSSSEMSASPMTGAKTSTGLGSSSEMSASPMTGSKTFSGMGGTSDSSPSSMTGAKSSNSTGNGASSDQSEQRSSAHASRGADMLNHLSDRVDDFAREDLDKGGAGSRAADFVYGFTDLVDGLARSVREGDIDPFWKQLSSQVRRSPIKAVGISLCLGFLVGRAIR